MIQNLPIMLVVLATVIAFVLAAAGMFRRSAMLLVGAGVLMTTVAGFAAVSLALA